MLMLILIVIIIIIMIKVYITFLEIHFVNLTLCCLCSNFIGLFRNCELRMRMSTDYLLKISSQPLHKQNISSSSMICGLRFETYFSNIICVARVPTCNHILFGYYERIRIGPHQPNNDVSK